MILSLVDSVIPQYIVLLDQGFNGCLNNIKLTGAGGTEKHVHFSQANLSSSAEVKLNLHAYFDFKTIADSFISYC